MLAGGFPSATFFALTHYPTYLLSSILYLLFFIFLLNHMVQKKQGAGLIANSLSDFQESESKTLNLKLVDR
jgi:prolipoprotein diacylglyceryltransferase